MTRATKSALRGTKRDYELDDSEIEARARKLSREYSGDEDSWPVFCGEARDQLDHELQSK